MMPHLLETSDGVVIPVQVVPRAGRTQIDGVVEGRLRVRLAAPPVEGAANRELCAFLAKLVQRPKHQVRVLAGEHSRQKQVLVAGVTPMTIRHHLASHVG